MDQKDESRNEDIIFCVSYTVRCFVVGRSLQE